MDYFRVKGVDGWVQVAAAGDVVLQARSGSAKIHIGDAAPELGELAFFMLKPENENAFSMTAAGNVYAASAGNGAEIIVSQDGA